MLNILTKFFTAFLLALTIGLSLTNNAIAGKADPDLVNKYIEKLEGQTEVDLRNRNMGDKGATALAEALMSNKTVHTLNLNFNRIGEEGAAALAEALSFNNILRELYLEGNNIRADHATKEYSRVGKDGIKYTLRGELEKNKKIAKTLKFDPQIIAFLISVDKSWLPKEVALTIAGLKALHSAGDLDLGQFVSIPGGSYEIGSPTTEPDRNGDENRHGIELSPFSIMEAAVTQESYAKVMGDNPSKFKKAKYCPLSFKEIEVNGKKIPVCADHPVETVSWDDANKFAELLSTQGPYKYSLPTEAQLEVAFRGGTTAAYVSGKDDETGLGNFVWYSANSRSQTHPVKSTKKNAFGIRRSSVWEWAQDRYNKDYAGSTGLDPQGPESGSLRVFRGGSWLGGASRCRSAYRNHASPGASGDAIGFRLVRT